MLLCSIVFLMFFQIKYCWCYQINWGDYRQTPQEIMVDVVNELGVKLLALHNEHNDNNIAISPYGALSVLIALGEGLQGDAVDEILHAAHIPHDVSIIRIGVRDIHRHLKSYFIPDEGFLAGLLLSHDNVTLNREYEDILRFYGFDIESFNSALYPDFTTTTTTVKPETTTDSTTVGDNEETTTSTTTTTPASTTDSVIKETTEITTETPPVGSDNKNEVTTETVESTTLSPSTTETEITSTSTEMAPTSTVIDTTTTEIVGETTELSTEIPTTETMGKIKRSAVDYAIARYYDEHAITKRPPPPPPSVTDLTFFVNEQSRESNINFMIYDTILPFFYISHLDTFALRFPLDSSRYYLLLLLPAKDTGIDKLICNLRLEGSLRYIIKNLKYTHVRAIIPSFMLKGYVVLTSTFQKLGVRKVFEPRHADFTPMTMDRGIYVTNIEQAITVTIRNYMNPDKDNHLRYLHHYEPVLFKADHPFLYFVIDSDIHVSLMAGKIVNPLNSRIK